MAEKIRAKREQLGFTQGEVVERVKRLSESRFSQQAYSKIENGQTSNSRFLFYVLQVLDLLDLMRTGSEAEADEIMLSRIKDLPPELKEDAMKHLDYLHSLKQESPKTP